MADRKTENWYRYMLTDIAAKNNTTPEEVDLEMRKTVELLWENPETREKLPFKMKPEPEEFVRYAVLRFTEKYDLPEEAKPGEPH